MNLVFETQFNTVTGSTKCLEKPQILCQICLKKFFNAKTNFTVLQH